MLKNLEVEEIKMIISFLSVSKEKKGFQQRTKSPKSSKRVIFYKKKEKKMCSQPKFNSIKIFLLCPIPEEQKPIADYIQYRHAKEKGWQNLFFWFQASTTQKRLKEPIVFYEEGSWFDGQIWEKPFSVIKNDRLLASQKMKFFSRIL